MSLKILKVLSWHAERAPNSALCPDLRASGSDSQRSAGCHELRRQEDASLFDLLQPGPTPGEDALDQKNFCALLLKLAPS